MTEQDVESTADAVRLQVVEAFIDGERVDPDRLENALADASARRHLVELLELRGAVAAMGPHEWSAARRVHGRARVIRWMAAAAALLVCVTAGYVAGQRVVLAEPMASHIETVMTLEDTPAAPAPTRVIVLEPGVNWTDSAKGQ